MNHILWCVFLYFVYEYDYNSLIIIIIKNNNFIYSLKVKIVNIMHERTTNC